MPLAAILGLLVLALLVTLVGERGGNRRVVLPAKAVASLCFVAVGLIHIRSVNAFGLLMMIGLCLAFFGDLMLVWRRTFPVGLIAFLLAHGAFATAFATLRPLGDWPVAPLLAVAFCSTLALAWLWPHLGALRLAVVAYVGVMTVMVWGAAAVSGAAVAPLRLVAGALLFYASDLAVARNRFVSPGFVNRAWGLPLYYLGQVLIATCVR